MGGPSGARRSAAGRAAPTLVLACAVVACTSLGGLSSKDGDPSTPSDGGSDDGRPVSVDSLDGGCSPGYASCPANGAGACNTNVAGDPKNCGDCGAVCFERNTSAAPACRAGVCAFTCAAGYADCNHAGSDGCEASTSDDAANCGACGHGCNGGACVAGVCKPAVVAPLGAADFGYSSPIVLDDGTVYFDAQGAVASCPASGCAQAKLVTPTGYQISGIATDATSVFFDDYTSGKILSCPKSGCAQPTVLAAASEPQPGGVAVDASRVYFTTITNVFNGVGQLLSCPKAGCGGAQPATLASNLDFPKHLIVVGTRLLWTSAEGIWIGTLPACSDATKLALNEAAAMATDGTTLYYTDGSSSLFSCPLSGCAQNPQVVGLRVATAGVGAMAVDDRAIYFSENESQGYSYTYTTRIRACPKAGCTTANAVVELTGQPNGLMGIGVDAAFLYWVGGDSSAGSSLLRLAKP